MVFLGFSRKPFRGFPMSRLGALLLFRGDIVRIIPGIAPFFLGDGYLGRRRVGVVVYEQLPFRNCSPHIIRQTINVSSIGRRLDTKLHEQMKICVNSMLCLMARPQIHLPNVKTCLDVVNTKKQPGHVNAKEPSRTRVLAEIKLFVRIINQITTHVLLPWPSVSLRQTAGSSYTTRRRMLESTLC